MCSYIAFTFYIYKFNYNIDINKIKFNDICYLFASLFFYTNSCSYDFLTNT